MYESSTGLATSKYASSTSCTRLLPNRDVAGVAAAAATEGR